jgi:hypothetical protein
MLFEPTLQKYWKEDSAGSEPSLLVQEVKLVRAMDLTNEMTPPAARSSSTRSEQSSAAVRSMMKRMTHSSYKRSLTYLPLVNMYLR